jgi:prepilin-type processing-associated H-X9-DG protein
MKEPFKLEANIQQPSLTPIFGDGVELYWGGGGFGPRATDLPAVNLATGVAPETPWGMSSFTISRHGSRPLAAPTDYSPRLKLPGAINAGFYDGHTELVQLERLWQLSWHVGYQPPAKRPGL